MRSTSNRPFSSAATTPLSTRLGVVRPTRRQALRLLGGAGFAAAISRGGRNAWAQEAATPPVATPLTGQQVGGSTVWRVQVGAMDMTARIELHTYYPKEISVNKGDSVWFDFGMGGFHTVSFPSGGEVPALLIPDPERPATESEDGPPPQLILNPAVVFPQGGDSFDGAGFLSSGIDVFRDPADPFVLTFAKTGSYDYRCAVHGTVMKGTVVVQESGAAAPRSQADYDRQSEREMAEGFAAGKAEKARYGAATSSANADGTTSWGVSIGAGGESQVRIQAFLPGALEVKVGDTVKWIHRSNEEPHTVSFLGANEAPPEDGVEQFADGSPKFLQSMEVFLPQGGNVWSGKGWANSGFMGVDGLPTEYELTFDTPGDFTYFCFLHGDAQGEGMAAKLKVTPR